VAGLVSGMVAGLVVELSGVGHAGQRAEAVHLAHRHGDGGGAEAGGDQGMGDHHEGQLIQTWKQLKQQQSLFQNKIQLHSLIAIANLLLTKTLDGRR